jgi:hypothetical protein
MVLGSDNANGIVGAGKGHEAEAARFARVPVLHDHRLLERAELREVGLQQARPVVWSPGLQQQRLPLG